MDRVVQQSRPEGNPRTRVTFALAVLDRTGTHGTISPYLCRNPLQDEEGTEGKPLMTTDASVAMTDTKAADSRPPRTIRLALIAAFVTAVLAGPVTLALFLAGLAATGAMPFSFMAGSEVAKRSTDDLANFTNGFGLLFVEPIVVK